MPAKSNVIKSISKSGGFKFKWWMGVGLVVVVALVGVLVLRFSHASTEATCSGSCINYTAGVLTPGGNPAPIRNIEGPKNLTTNWTLPAGTGGDPTFLKVNAWLNSNRKYKVCVYGAKIGGNGRVLVQAHNVHTSSPSVNLVFEIPLDSNWKISCGTNGEFFLPPEFTNSTLLSVSNIDYNGGVAYIGSIVVYPE